MKNFIKLNLKLRSAIYSAFYKLAEMSVERALSILAQYDQNIYSMTADEFKIFYRKKSP